MAIDRAQLLKMSQAELDDVFLDANDQTAVDTHLAKLIYNHCNALVMLCTQDAIDQGRLATP